MPEEDYVDDSAGQLNQPQQSTSLAEKATNAVNKTGSAVKAAGTTTQAAGKTAQVAGKAAKVAGKGAQVAGKGVQAGSAAAGTALSAIPVVGAPLGAAVKATGSAAGKGLDVAGKGAEKAGSAIDKAGSKVDDAGKRIREKGNRLKNFGKGKSSGGVTEKLQDSSGDNPLRKESSGDKGLLGKLKAGLGLGKDKANEVLNKFIDVVKKAKKAIMTALMPFILLLVVLAIIVNYAYEIFEAVDNVADTVANTVEKYKNFITGLGFNNSEVAFYQELDELQEQYNNNLDIPLLMSALFYDDIQNNMDPSDVEAEVVTDQDSLLSFSTVFSWIGDKLEESQVEVGADGLKYSSNKIYRLRILAEYMMDYGNNETDTMTWSDYFKKYVSRIGSSIAELFSLENIVQLILAALAPEFLLGSYTFELGKSVVQILTDSEVFETTDFHALLTDNIITDIIDVVKAIFMPIAEIDGFTVCEATLCVRTKKYSKNEEEFYKHLKEDYIPRMPEFKKYLDGGENDEKEIDRIIEGIKDIYDDYKFYFMLPDENSENLNNGNKGNIDNDLVAVLRLPIDTSGIKSITGRDAFGLFNGVMHNGVTLTHTNSGINVGDNVYSVADGTVVGITRNDGTSAGDVTSISSSSFNKYDLTEEELKNITSQCLAEQGSYGINSVKAEASLMANRYEFKGQDYGSLYEYVRDVGWFNKSYCHMDPNYKSNPDCKKSKGGYWEYYEATEEQLNAVRDVLVNGNRTLPKYIDEHDDFGDIDYIEIDGGGKKSDRASINNRDNYIKDKTVIHFKGTYTFYEFPDPRSDPFGYTAEAYNKYANIVEEKTNSIKIEHHVTAAGKSFHFYTIYKYLGEISGDIEVGKQVTKGQVIGKVGTVEGYSEASLYFEFDDENKTPINPTNLFIPIDKELVGRTNKEKIWFYMQDKGLTKAGTAAVMGNMIHESSFNSVSLEGTVARRTGYTSEQFTAAVDSGQISRSEFICSYRFALRNSDGTIQGVDTCKKFGYTGGEGIYGYGLFGFTYPSIKENLLKHTLDVGVSIGDLKAQMDSFVDYLGQANPSLLEKLKTTNDPREAAEAILLQYERPASIDRPDTRAAAIKNRGDSAENVYKEMKDLVRPVSESSNQTPSSSGFIWPTKSTHITSYFGYRGYIGVDGATTYHHAIDIGGSIGDPVYAAASGVVYDVDRTNNRGIYVLVKHDNGFMTRYQHLNKALVSKGDRVSQGQVIAELGDTGIGSGPHLHFEVYTPDVKPELGYSSNAVNPLNYVTPPNN